MSDDSNGGRGPRPRPSRAPVATTNAEIIAAVATVATELQGFIQLTDERDRQAMFQRARMEAETAAAREDTQALSTKLEGMLEAWKNASFLLAVVKWSGGAIVAVSGFWYVVTHLGQGK